jgi:hypothetical protein
MATPPRLREEARALVVRLRESLGRPGDLPTRYRRWLVIGRAEARRHRRETGQRFEQSPSRRIVAASAALARREGLCPPEADESAALLAYLRSLEPTIAPLLAEQVTPRPAASAWPDADVQSGADRWQPEPEGPPH